MRALRESQSVPTFRTLPPRIPPDREILEAIACLNRDMQALDTAIAAFERLAALRAGRAPRRKNIVSIDHPARAGCY
jgi:hypothetical protein